MVMQKKWRLILLLVGCFLGGIGVVQAHAAVPDISEWQGQLTSTEVQSLKSQADFVINRVQYGSSYEDLYHTSNESLYVKYGVPFGSYDYATFTSTATAKAEADKFYQRANKNTKFYVLDFETTSMSSTAANAAVKAWYTEMRSLTSKKLIFYSYQSFATTYANTARQSFDAQWIANYSSKPTISFSLWQYSSSYYLSSLGQYVDNSLYDSASVTTYHPLSWWTSGTSASSSTSSTSTTYAYSSYTKGQHVYLNNGASSYYDGTKVPSSAKKKYYKVTATKSVTKSRSKQLVYLSGLNKWVLSQDVTGYWVGQHRLYQLREKSTLFKDVNLTTSTGKTLKKGGIYSGKLVKSGNFYRIKVSGGYITAKVSKSDHWYYESVPSSGWIKTKVGLYTYKSSNFVKSNRHAYHAAGDRIKVTKVYSRSGGSRYYLTNKGNYVSANRSNVVTQ
ncbi:GH25 family lysozyme [Lactiplantibacillus plantarum]|uniref:GH25 family lysozyme n=1 Tax=Lactiplantibacillus plantarum TaxID=1590 RepID=UPI0011520ACD|nr:GH25 family lysozyme [Lactiplantibacillus plantarum]QDJ19947.1 glycosyl hydrolase family 25 [Lactiplantibacillus plantarum]